MLSKLVVLFLGASLILQGYNAAPYQNMESSHNALRERLKLVHIYATELNELFLLVLGNCKSLVEQILSAPEVLEIKTDLMKSKLDEMKEFVKMFDEYEREGKYDQKEGTKISAMFNDIEKKYDVNKKFEIEEDKVIANFIKGTGFERVNEAFKVRARAFIDKFCNEVQTYVDGLNEVEKTEEKQLLEFLAAEKAQTDYMKQGDLIKDFLDSFDLEEFVW